MNDTDRIVAAIFTTGLCQGKPMGPADYFRVYDECLKIVSEREAAAKKARPGLKVSDKAMEWAKKKGR